MIAFALVGGALLYWSFNRTGALREMQAAVESAVGEFRAYVFELQRTRVIPPHEDPAFLAEAGEFIALRYAQSTMQECRTARLSAGLGTRMEGAGIPIYLGGSQSHAADELREVAEGTLYLTNRRLVFTGGVRTFALDIDDILSIENGLDWIRVQSTHQRKPAVLTVPNGFVWAGVFRILSEVRPDRPRLDPGAIAVPLERVPVSPIITRGKGKLFDP